MTPERWARMEAVLAAAIERPRAERAALLDRECADDAALRREVESLIAELDEEPEFLENAVAWAADSSVETAIPERIGPYRIVRLLGRGGMGQVWLAEREAPGFRQQVALKLLRRGLDTDDLIARFRAERQILARLNHPNIARLYDVGATDDGLPYYVMEYVDGVPLVEYCDRARLGIAERLRLFTTVCDAVHHAHRRLIVHRDLKPGNVLVSEEGAPKLLDFGIAKVLRGDEDGAADLTTGHVRLLTPEYAAPEQIRGEPATTACDVYALGILLYELLAGRHPHRGTAGLDDPDRSRRSSVRPPSQAVASDADKTAAARGLSPEQLRRRIRGDLDMIALTALAEEPDARYASVLGLVDDIGRHQAGQPVRARPPTWRYRAGRFLARHRIPVAAAAALALVLVTSSAVTTVQSQRIREQSLVLTRERDKALEVQSFLLEMFGAAGPDQPAGDALTARQLLDRRAAALDAYGTDPETRAAMLTVLAEGYERLGLYESAEPLAREGLAIRRTTLGPLHADLAVSLNVLGWVMRQRGDDAAADSLLREAVAVGRSVFPASGDARLARALNDLGVLRASMGELAEAASLLRASIDMRLRIGTADLTGVAVATSNLAVVLYQGDQLDAAIAAADSARARFERTLGPDHQRTLTVLFNLAAMRSAHGDRAAAVDAHRELLERRRRLFGAAHPSVAQSMVMIANELRASGEFDAGIALLDSALAIQRTVYGDRHAEVATTLRVRGHVNAGAGRHADALVDFERALTSMQSTPAPAHPEAVVVFALQAQSHTALGDDASAELAWRAAARTAEQVYGANHTRTFAARLDLIEHLLRVGRNDEAAADLATVERAIQNLGDDGDDLRRRVDTLRAAIPAAIFPGSRPPPA